MLFHAKMFLLIYIQVLLFRKIQELERPFTLEEIEILLPNDESFVIKGHKPHPKLPNTKVWVIEAKKYFVFYSKGNIPGKSSEGVDVSYKRSFRCLSVTFEAEEIETLKNCKKSTKGSEVMAKEYNRYLDLLRRARAIVEAMSMIEDMVVVENSEVN